MTDSLREKIADAMRGAFSANDQGHYFVHDVPENECTIIDGSWDLRVIADEILAIPELADALRLKPIKTMPVRGE